MAKSTMVELVAELEKLPPTLGIRTMIAEARAGEYHDYKNEKYACGKVAVVHSLEEEARRPTTPKPVREQLRELARQVREGEYDEQADAEDIENMRKTAPREMWPILGL